MSKIEVGEILEGLVSRYAKIAMLMMLLISGNVYALGFSFDIITTLSYIQNLLSHIGPILSAVLFIIAGMFYAIGQLLPATKRAAFHTTAVDILMGAIIVAVLSVASNGLAIASTQLLTNITANTLV